MSECKNDRVPIIEFRGITKRFSGVTVLDHVSFEIQKGEEKTGQENLHL